MTTSEKPPEGTGKEVYHYCSIAALRSIIESKELWLTNIFFMNDALEVKWLYQKAASVVEQRRNGARTVKDLAQRTDLHLYYSAITEYLRQSFGFGHVYCACFTDRPDDLSQWRGYAAEGRGVAVRLDLDEIKQHNGGDQLLGRLRDERVRYDEGQLEKEIEAVVEEYLPTVFDVDQGLPIRQAWLAYLTLSSKAPYYKNPKFEAEAESRILLRPDSHCADIDAAIREVERLTKHFPGEQKRKVWFRSDKPTLVPYVKIRLPLTAIKGIVVGPQFGRNEEEIVGLKLLLAVNGADITKVKFWQSAVSYRS
jgi:hypothetical protein